MEDEVLKKCDAETIRQSRVLLREARRYKPKGQPSPKSPKWSPQYEALVSMAAYEIAMAEIAAMQPKEA